MKKSMLVLCGCLLVASCSSEGPFIRQGSSMEGPSTDEISASLGLDIRPFDFSVPEGFITEFKIETFNNKPGEPVQIYRGNYGPLPHMAGEPLPEHKGRVLFSMMPLGWIGEKFEGKVRLSFSPCMNKPSSLVIDHPFANSKGMCTVMGSGHCSSEGKVHTFTSGSDRLSEKEWRTFLCYYDDTNPRLSVSARLIPWPPVSTVEKK